MARPYSCDEYGCTRSFPSPNALEHHRITHLTRSVHCYGCTRMFTTYHGMIIHLEAGNCTSGIEMRRVNRLAAQCFQWKQYIVKHFREELRGSHVGYRGDPANRPFKCPTCTSTFPLLSSLFMHIHSPSCDQTIGGGAIGKLKKWLRKSLKRMKVRN
ncbi:uncharacterized protein MYCFIDRAFT_211925 [Pseudocercospora fijiensis CIRAD86]|uniref:C2H2-type domain-containing protein n=1 Tax=Pseudocercospora fijiensis (strain CIRAD86) TaxID=383855 RepID=M3A5S2_PSEFD|nr:uncharacterized protein MYCFIDRAFT_211925 [Pseudocercospora fijiensis CIRAD86]EME79976.1 hypothetical protein MYCFIDRAFT_211925 [Pseudocercospora fijiensis CIRAD86]